MAIGMDMAGLSIICKLVTGYKLLHMTAETSWYLSSIYFYQHIFYTFIYYILYCII